MISMSRYIGDKEFYKKTARIAIPFALMNMLMSGQAMIDTMMVTRIGMVSAVGTAAQIDTLCSLISYGCNGGISMFASQFYGAGDKRNLKRCLGFSLILVVSNALFWILLATLFGEQILRFYLNDDEVIVHSLQYLQISKFSLLLGAFNYSFSNLLRSTQQAKISLAASICATVTKVTMNALLIFGLGPFPALGIRGAALGTIIAQCVSVCILLSYSFATHQAFLGSFKEVFGLDKEFVKPILAKIGPLILNESTFGFGQTMFIKAFGALGKQPMDAYYVGNQIFNLLTFIIYGYGNAVQILLGADLGRGNLENARRDCDYHIGLAGFLSAVLVTFLLVFARPLVTLFGLSDPATSSMAVLVVYAFAVKASMRLYNYMIFCVLRSGGDASVIPFLDSGLQWAVGIPLAFASVHLFGLKNIALVLLITQAEQLIRFVLGMRRVKQYRWVNDLTKTVAA